MTADDATLQHAVQRAQNGDDEAFADAYRIVQPGLLGYLRGLVGESAEDVASDAWLEIARDLARFRGDGAGFRGWTATIARHRALDHLRRLRCRLRTVPFEQETLDLPSPRETAGEALEAISTAEALALVAGLPGTRLRRCCCAEVVPRWRGVFRSRPVRVRRRVVLPAGAGVFWA